MESKSLDEGEIIKKYDELIAKYDDVIDESGSFIKASLICFIGGPVLLFGSILIYKLISTY